MQLPLEDVELFFRLHRSLMFFVNQRLNVIDEKVATPDAYSVLPPTNRIEVHKTLLEHMDLIDAFPDENPFDFDETDLEIVRSWRNLVAGTFYAYRQLQEYMVFLSSTEPVIAYGVVALFDPFEVVIGLHPPRMVKTTLLPSRAGSSTMGSSRVTTLPLVVGFGDGSTRATRKPRSGSASSHRSRCKKGRRTRPRKRRPPKDGR